LDLGGATVAAGAAVVFDDIILDQSPNISYSTGTGIFTITAPGNYFVTWWIATDGSDGPTNVSFAVELNGAGGIIGSSPVVTGQVSGYALITVTTTPSTVTLINVTGAAVLYAATTVQANMTILEVALP